MKLVLFMLLILCPKVYGLRLIGENEKAKVTGNIFTVIVHDSFKFEPARISAGPIAALVAASQNAGIPVIELSAEKYEKYKLNVDIYVKSSGGQHGLELETAATLFIAGGNLSQCLCETLRDFIKNSKVDLKIVLITNAIYDHAAFWLGPGEGHRQLLLSELSESQRLTQGEFSDLFFGDNVLGVTRGMCPKQNILNSPAYLVEDNSLIYKIGKHTFEFKNANRRTVSLSLAAFPFVSN